MILESERENEDARLDVSLMPPLQDLTPVAVATPFIPIAIMKEEEETTMPVEELDRYFLSLLIDSTFSTISSHLEAMH